MRKNLVREIINDFLRIQTELGRPPTRRDFFSRSKHSKDVVNEVFPGGFISMYTQAMLLEKPPEEKTEPKILIFDIETSHMLVRVWRCGEQRIRPDQIVQDWNILCCSAKWLNEKDVMCVDLSKQKNKRDDRKILKWISDLLNEADYVISKNGKRFDEPKIRWRIIKNGFKPPKPFVHIDTEKMIRSSFAPSSTKLEFLSEALDLEHKKSKHCKFPGENLWIECEADNQDAWKEMRDYNIKDVLATEELYKKILPHCKKQPGVDLNAARSGNVFRCQCGSSNLVKRGYAMTVGGKHQQYQCRDCGQWCKETGSANNLLSKKKISSLRGR